MRRVCTWFRDAESCAGAWSVVSAHILVLFLCACGGREPVLVVKEIRTWPVAPEATVQPAPRSVAVGGSNEVYVLDTAGRGLVYTTDGALLRQWRMPDIRAGRPEGLWVLKDGQVVVCDTHYHRVLVFDLQGGVARSFGREGQGAGEFVYPVAVAADTAENLYIAEYGGNDRVQVFTREGLYLRSFGTFGTGPGAFQRPSGLVWRDGRVFVADAFNNRIQVFSDDGLFIEVLAGAGLRFPYDVKLGPTDTLYVVEYGAGRVTRLGLDGRLLGRYGTSGPGAGEFATPWGLGVTRDGRVIVADTGNRRLVELKLE